MDNIVVLGVPDGSCGIVFLGTTNEQDKFNLVLRNKYAGDFKNGMIFQNIETEESEFYYLVDNATIERNEDLQAVNLRQGTELYPVKGRLRADAFRISDSQNWYFFKPTE